MEMYGAHSRSLPQKLVILCAELGLLALAYSVLFGEFLAGLRASADSPQLLRNQLLFAFNIVVVARFMLTLFVFLRRKIPLEETFSVPLAFALYLLGFPLLAQGSGVPVGAPELVGLVLFVVGSLLNSVGEYQRHVFKQRADNKGKLFDGGLFSLSIHINYFGDLLWVTGYACVTHNIYAAAIPAFLFCFFQFFNIPKLDSYLREHYGAAFEAYENRTKRFIPFVL